MGDNSLSGSDHEQSWLEAELERELEEISLSEDEASNPDDDRATSHGIPDASTVQPELQTNNGLRDTLPESFKELLQCFHELDESMAAKTAAAIEGTENVMADLEKQLLGQPKSAWAAEEWDDDESISLKEKEKDKLAGLEAERSQASTEKVERYQAIQNLFVKKTVLAELPIQENMHNPDTVALGDLLLVEAAQEGSLSDVSGPNSSQELHALEIAESNVELSHNEAQSNKHLEEEQQRINAEHQRIEAEHRACMAKLEAEKQAVIAKLRQEEERAKQEEMRSREERGMHSEEIRCRDFYQWERESQRRERRAMTVEDQAGRNRVIEEKRLQQNAELRMEAGERSWMAREDRLGQRLREYENALRELSCMSTADEEAAAFRTDTKLMEERAAMESRRMAHEDVLGQCVRQSAPAGLSHVAHSRQTSGVSRQAQRPDPTKALSNMVCLRGAMCTAQQPIRNFDSGKTCSSPWQPTPGLSKSTCVDTHGTPSSSRFIPFAPSVAFMTSDTKADTAEKAHDIPPGRVSEIINPWDDTAPQETINYKFTRLEQCIPEDGQNCGIFPQANTGDLMCCGAMCSLKLSFSPELCNLPKPCRPRDFKPTACKKKPEMVTKSDSLNGTGGEGAFAGEQFGREVLDTLEGIPAQDILRLELRMESLTQVPNLSFAPELRILILSGNKLKDLAPIQNCCCLEELALCQNSLTSLNGLHKLKKLTILRANMNEISNIDGICSLPALCHVELSKNRLRSVELRSPHLTKLVLYHNSIKSMEFLESSPSLTELDLGRNHLTCIDSRISTWNPFLMKFFVYDNSIGSLPEFRLPLLTDLWVDKNKLKVLGPLGFLPSLERLQAKHNDIKRLATPISVSPLLQNLELAFNQLESEDCISILHTYTRLRRLQLNDNPGFVEMMEKYRPWVLRHAPFLMEIDNETVSEDERRNGVLWQTSNDPHFGFQFDFSAHRGSWRGTPSWSSNGVPLRIASRGTTNRQCGLLDLTEPTHDKLENCSVQVTRAHTQSSCALGVQDVMQVQRASLFRQWEVSGSAGSGYTGGCNTCALAQWCLSLTACRCLLLSTYSRDERRRAVPTVGASSSFLREEVLMTLRDRGKFWDDFLIMCHGYYQQLSQWPFMSARAVQRNKTFEARGREVFKCSRTRKIQARWRGVLGRRKRCARELEQRCNSLTEIQRRRIVHVQAAWRGAAVRQSVKASGQTLPKERRRAKLSQAAVRMQAALRGSRVRRRLRMARNMSKMVEDELADLPEVDVAAILGNIEGLDVADPFDIQVPVHQHVPFSTSSPSAMVTAMPKLAAATPKVAWSTPPPSAPRQLQAPQIGALQCMPQRHLLTSADGSTASSPQSSRTGSAHGTGLPRRSRSMSSTAESAVTENEGNLQSFASLDRDDLQVDPAAQAYLMAQKRRRPKPPKIPTAVRPSAPASGTSFIRGPSQGSLRSSHSSKSLPPGVRKQAPKAQDAIAEFRRQQEAEQRQHSSEAVDFRSGEPNLKLLRSCSGLSGQPHCSSPRARSPHRLAV